MEDRSPRDPEEPRTLTEQAKAKGIARSGVIRRAVPNPRWAEQDLTDRLVAFEREQIREELGIKEMPEELLLSEGTAKTLGVSPGEQRGMRIIKERPCDALMTRALTDEEIRKMNEQAAAAYAAAIQKKREPSARVEGMTLYEFLDEWKKQMGLPNWSLRVTMTDPERSTEWELVDNGEREEQGEEHG